MIINITPLKFLLYNLVLVALVIFNLHPYLQLAAGILFLILNSLALGNYLFLKNSWGCKIIYGFLFLITGAGLIGTAFFYLSKLSSTAFISSLILLPTIIYFFARKKKLVIEINFNWFSLKKIQLLPILYLILFSFFFYLLFTYQTDQSIRSPWEILPPQIFVLYFILTFVLLAMLTLAKSGRPLFFIILHSFLSFSVAWVMYKIGFDYDPFIHRTNLNLILKNGTLLPKPFYYIGQYSVLIFLHNLLQIPAGLLDKIFVPLMAAIYIPSTIYYAFKDNFKVSINLLLITTASFLLFPFSSFISTTPQSLANLFFLITILLALYYITHPKVTLWPLGLLVILTLAIHPIAGLPLLFFFIILTIYQHWKKQFKLPKILHQSILWEFIILGGLALPTAFLLNSLTLSELKVTVAKNWWQNISQVISSLNIDLYYRKFISFTDLVYSFGNNSIILTTTLAIIGIYFITKNKQFKKYAVYLFGFIVLILNFLLLKAMIVFFSLQAYEQITYPARVFVLAILILSPFILVSLYLFYKKLFEQKKLVIFFTIIFVALGLSMSFYLSYPRVDKIVEDHGYSTSLTDIKTVNFIDKLQNGEPYVVLASQPVSAAAIKELGFKYYYNNYFFYPVPTGGRLYQLYEDIAYYHKKTVDAIATVKYLTGVDDVYFILNDYWYDFDMKLAAEKEISSKWYSIDGKNYIFKY